MRSHVPRWLQLHAIVLYAFLYLPILILVVYSFNGEGVGGFPPRHLTLSWYAMLAGDGALWDSVLNSVLVALAAVAIALRSQYQILLTSNDVESVAFASRNRHYVLHVLDTIADTSDVQISDGELTDYLVHQARRYQMAPQEFANQVMQGGNLPALIADVRRNKALASVLENAVVTDESGNKVDLSALSPAALADASEGNVRPDHDHADEDAE